MRWITTQMFASLVDRLVNRKLDGREAAQQLAHIRSAMLELLGDDGVRRHPNVARRIRFGADEMALWYARSDLVAALADLYDEETAQRQVARQASLFKGLLPKSMMARPGAQRGC